LFKAKWTGRFGPIKFLAMHTNIEVILGEKSIVKGDWENWAWAWLTAAITSKGTTRLDRENFLACYQLFNALLKSHYNDGRVKTNR
jgi:hypothetical protein